MPAIAAPMPYFGGKRRAAPIVWAALGDPAGYVEPFAGSAAVLLARPRVASRRVETLNDADGWLVNMWRALQHDPAGVADAAYGPVTEIDYHARSAWLQERRSTSFVAWLEGDPEAHDAKAAGWWLYVCACGIGDPWEAGPWRVVDGHLVKGDAGQGVTRELPHLGNRGVKRELPPHLGDAGQGALLAYFSRLQSRLAHVRITCGDWARVVQPSAFHAGSGGDGKRAVFLDPPYSTSPDLYGHRGADITSAVREWCRTADPALRIVLAGYLDDHDDLLALGWRKVRGRAGGGSGYNADAGAGQRERLWLSPACLGGQGALDLGGVADALLQSYRRQP